jgi:BlaI family penicillinase repressor
MARASHKLTEGEWAIMQAVWKLEPCAAPTVQEALARTRKWSYSTVKTMMDRMVAKGLLVTEKMRNLVLYRSAVTRRQAQRGEVMRTIKQAFNGALTPMMQFLLEGHDFTEEQLGELEALIHKKRGKSARPRRRGPSRHPGG